MKETFHKSAYRTPISNQQVEEEWRQKGFTFGVFQDSAGQEWNDFVHDTDEFVVVARGELEIIVGDESATCSAGDLVWIPKNVRHSLKTISQGGSTWLYGYGDGNGK